MTLIEFDLQNRIENTKNGYLIYLHECKYIYGGFVLLYTLVYNLTPIAPIERKFYTKDDIDLDNLKEELSKSDGSKRQELLLKMKMIRRNNKINHILDENKDKI